MREVVLKLLSRNVMERIPLDRRDIYERQRSLDVRRAVPMHRVHSR